MLVIAVMWWMLIHQPKRRRTVSGENGWKTLSGSVMKMHCALCTAFTLKPEGWSLQVTAFATESTHFKLESSVEHVESAKHKKCRDMWVAKCSGSSGSIIKAFNLQDAHIWVVLNDVWFDIIEYIAKNNILGLLSLLQPFAVPAVVSSLSPDSGKQ